MKKEQDLINRLRITADQIDQGFIFTPQLQLREAADMIESLIERIQELELEVADLPLVEQYFNTPY